MAKGHIKPAEDCEFCAIRAGKRGCPCGNNHIDNAGVTKFDRGDAAAAAAAPWSFFRRRSWAPWIRREKFFEAHHLLCVASVNAGLSASPTVFEIVKKTDWCINAKPNMLAMPLWGHTLKHYANPANPTPSGPPSFADIPQHNYNHNSTGGYKDEVDKTIEAVANEVLKLKKKGHKAPEKDLANRLDTESDNYRSELAVRGRRRQGTHEAWRQGMREAHLGKGSNWYLPFSMASDGATQPRAFPVKGDKSALAEKLEKLLNGIGFT